MSICLIIQAIWLKTDSHKENLRKNTLHHNLRDRASLLIHNTHAVAAWGEKHPPLSFETIPLKTSQQILVYLHQRQPSKSIKHTSERAEGRRTQTLMLAKVKGKEPQRCAEGGKKGLQWVRVWLPVHTNPPPQGVFQTGQTHAFSPFLSIQTNTTSFGTLGCYACNNGASNPSFFLFQFIE